MFGGRLDNSVCFAEEESSTNTCEFDVLSLDQRIIIDGNIFEYLFTSITNEYVTRVLTMKISMVL